MERVLTTNKQIKKKKSSKGDLVFFVCLIVLPLLQFAIFYIGVNVSAFVLAFQKYDQSGNLIFNGVDNFKQVFSMLFTESNWKFGFTNSMIIFVLGIVINTPIVIVASYFIYKRSAMGRWMKVILFAPSIMAAIVHVSIYQYTVSELLPEILDKWFNVQAKSFLDDPATRFLTLYIFTLWGGFGSGMLLYTNAMDSIPKSVVEAAKIDGATFWGEFVNVTFPMVFGTIKTLFVVGVAGFLMNQFSLFEFFGNSASPTVQTVGYIVYIRTIEAGMQDYPVLSALGLVLSAIAIPVTVSLRRLTNRLDPMEN